MSWIETIKEELNKDRVLRWSSGIVAVLMSFALVFGEALQTEGELPVRQPDAWISVALSITVIWCVLVAFLCFIKRETHANAPIGDSTDKGNSTKIRKKLGLISRRKGPCFFAFLVCWLPSFLAVYPGFFLYDAYDEYMEVAKGIYSTHHPLLHVLLLGKTVDVVHRWTGSYNYGISLYLFLQMCVLAATFTYLLFWMKEKGVGRVARLVTFLYFAFFPVTVMFVLCTAKDTLFGAALLWILLLVQRKKAAPLAVACLLALLLRNNMLYALLGYGIFLVVVLLAGKEVADRKGKLFRLLTFLLAVLFLYTGIYKGMAVGLHAMKGGSQEMLTVPIQQIARCYQSNQDMYSEEEKALLFTYLPESALKRYTPNLSDPVKVSFDSDAYRSNASGFWKLWVKGLFHNPVGYVNAWCMTSYGFWYPNAVIDVYRGHSVFTHEYEKSSYFGFETEKPGIRESRLPGLESYYRVISLDGRVQRRPVLSWLFSMGMLTFVFLVCMAVMMVRRRWKRVLLYLLPALVWLTFLLGPTFLPRYMVFQWFLLPLLLADTFCTKEK